MRSSAFFLRVCFSEAFRESLFVVFSWFFLLSLLACLVGFSVFFVVVGFTAYYMSCGMSYVFVEFFSCRGGRVS